MKIRHQKNYLSVRPSARVLEMIKLARSWGWLGDRLIDKHSALSPPEKIARRGILWLGGGCDDSHLGLLQRSFWGTRIFQICLNIVQQRCNNAHFWMVLVCPRHLGLNFSGISQNLPTNNTLHALGKVYFLKQTRGELVHMDKHPWNLHQKCLSEMQTGPIVPRPIGAPPPSHKWRQSC